MRRVVVWNEVGLRVNGVELRSGGRVGIPPLCHVEGLVN